MIMKLNLLKLITGMKDDPPAESTPRQRRQSPQWSRDNSTGKPSFNSGRSFLMYKASKSLTSHLLWLDFKILNWSLFILWPVISLCSKMAEFGVLAVGSLVRTDTPKCSEILHWNWWTVLPMYCLLQSRHLNLYTILEQMGEGSLSLWLKKEPILNLFLKTYLKLHWGKRQEMVCLSSVFNFSLR